MPVEDIADEDLDVGLARPLDRRRPGPDGRLRPWIEWFGAGRLIAGGLTAVVLVVGGWWLLRSPATPIEAGLPQATAPPSGTTAPAVPPTSEAPAAVIVHVAGAVTAPGVYELPTGARVESALLAAGGPTAEADPGALNLAALVADGERVYVPVVGEAPPPAPAGGSTPAPAGPIDLNRATVDQLDELPGIGPATATAIVDHRTANGPFASVEDLEAVRGIGPAKLDALRDLVAV